MKITHLCIYVPPVLGAYLLLHHAPKPPTFSIPNPAQSSQEETTWSVYPELPTSSFLLSLNNKQKDLEPPDKLPKACSHHTLSLFWQTPKLSLTKAKSVGLSNSRCPCLPNAPPTVDMSILLSTLKVGPSGEQALEGAVHYAAPFNYSNLASTNPKKTTLPKDIFAPPVEFINKRPFLRPFLTHCLKGENLLVKSRRFEERLPNSSQGRLDGGFFDELFSEGIYKLGPRANR